MGLLVGSLATYALVGPGLNLTTTVTSTITITVTTDSTQEVMSAYAAHLKNFEFENITAMIGEYEDNATLELVGNARGLAGQYNGAVNIGIAYQSLLSPNYFGPVNLANVSYAANVSGNGREATVNSTFTIHGSNTAFSYIIGPSSATTYFVANVNSGVTYVRLSSNWLISNETLDFVTFVVCGAISNC